MSEFSRGLFGAAMLDERISEAISALDGVESFMTFLHEFDFNLTETHHYHHLFKEKLLVWIETPIPPSTHKWVIEKLGGHDPHKPTIFWTSFLQCYFLEFAISKTSRDLTSVEAELIEMTCRLIQHLVRYGEHGECFTNVRHAGTYGACQFLSRTLRYYRDRQPIVDAALLAVLYLTHSKSNPSDKNEINQNASYLHEVADAPICGALYKVLKHWEKKPTTAARAMRALSNCAKCSLVVRTSFGDIPDACEELLRILRYYGTASSITGPDKTHADAAYFALRAVGTLCDSDVRDDGVREKFWAIPTLCESILASMWIHVDDHRVAHMGFKAVSNLVRRDERGQKREAFGARRFTCRRSKTEIGICDIVFKVATLWIQHVGYPHCIEEGVHCLSHLTHKDHAVNTAAFRAFWDDSEEEITEVRLRKIQIKRALMHKLNRDIEHAKKNGKAHKVKMLQDRLPLYLQPAGEPQPPTASVKVDNNK